jgi:hypothetical protein
MRVRIDSPPIIDYGEVPLDVNTQIAEIAQRALVSPGFVEDGRASRRIVLGENSEEDTRLHELALRLGEDYLGATPNPGSIAVISLVHDAAAYRRYTQASKAATYWHQDFVERDGGFFFPPENQTRLIIPSIVGSLCAVGPLEVINGVKIDARPDSGEPDKNATLNAGPTVIGSDGVLMKSEEDPLGGEIYQTEPDRVYVIPHATVHKANPVLPRGRILFQLDALADR